MPKIILSFDTKEDMDSWKAHTMWDADFGEPINEPDQREIELQEHIDSLVTITEEE